MTELDRHGRRRAAKRQAVKTVAVQLALDKGLDALTVETISDAADISRRTFFNYFATKEDALVMEPSWTARELRERYEARPLNEPTTRSLREVLKEVASGFEGQQTAAASFHELYRRHPHLQARRGSEQAAELSAGLVEAVAERQGQDPRRDFGAILVVALAFAVMQSAVLFCWSADNDRSIHELIDEGFDRLEQGL